MTITPMDDKNPVMGQAHGVIPITVTATAWQDPVRIADSLERIAVALEKIAEQQLFLGNNPREYGLAVAQVIQEALNKKA
jgi:hypothetical protein